MIHKEEQKYFVENSIVKMGKKRKKVAKVFNKSVCSRVNIIIICYMPEDQKLIIIIEDAI